MSKHIYTLLENRHFYRKQFRLHFVYFSFIFRILNTEALWFCTVVALWDSVTLGWNNTKSPVMKESVRESLIYIKLVLLAEIFKYYLFCSMKSLCVNCVAFVQSTDCRKHCSWKVISLHAQGVADSGKGESAGQAAITAISGLQTAVFEHFSFCTHHAAPSYWPLSPLGGLGFPALWTGELLFILFFHIPAPAVNCSGHSHLSSLRDLQARFSDLFILRRTLR